MTIQKPYHSESRTIWPVYDAYGRDWTLELGQVYRSTTGNEFKLVGVTWNTGLVEVEQLNHNHAGDRYIWRVESLINQHMILLEPVAAS